LVYLLSSLETGGAQTGMFRLLEGLAADEFDVLVVPLQVADETLMERLPAHVSLHDLGIDNKYRLGKLRPLWSLLSTADILVCSLFHATIVGRVLGRLQTVPTVVNWHHNEQFQGAYRRQLYARTNRFVDMILADSAAVERALRREFGAEVPVSTVPIAGIDIDSYPPVSHSETAPLTVGTLGTLTPQKNHREVLTVAAEMPDISFHIAGDGPLRAELEQEAASLPNMQFRGYVADVPAFLSEVDVYFQPSLFEGLCITVIEAMAAGLPVVGSDVGGISDSVAHGETGYLADPADTRSFIECIDRLRQHPDQRQAFGMAGREYVQRNYSRERLVDAFRGALREAGVPLDR